MQQTKENEKNVKNFASFCLKRLQINDDFSI